MSGFAPDPKQVPSVEDIQRAREAGILGGPEAPVPDIGEVGTPEAVGPNEGVPTEAQQEYAARVANRLRVDARDLASNNPVSNESLVLTLTEAADIIEGQRAMLQRRRFRR